MLQRINISLQYVMSEISKARQRILTRRQRSEVEEMIPDRKNPRKFTVSSLTQQLEHHPPEFSNTSSAIMGRRLTVDLKVDDELYGIRSPLSNVSQSKENAQPTMLKTVNVKIQEISHLQSPRQGETQSWMESRFVQSPPKVTYRRTLHRQPPELVMAVVPARRHLSPFKPRECLRQWAEGVLGEARLLGRAFVDQMFPPARTILFSRNVLCQQDHLRFEKLARIYMGSDVALLSACEPTLIHIGKYTNPYLFSALAILAEMPTRLLAMFGGQTFNEDGAYHVCLCKDGVWRYVVVDDFVPIKAVAGKKQFLCMNSRVAEGAVELWPALLEKAVAKVYGTYVDLMMSREAGMIDLFKLLTGAPASSYALNKDFRSFLILIDAALKRGHVVTLEGVREQQQETAILRNLKIHQAYRVLDIKKSGLKLRNYAEPQLSTKLGFDECLIFKRLVIYRTETTYRYVTHKLRHKMHFFSKLALTVPSTTRAYFDVWQNNPAYYKKFMGANILYSPSRFKMWLSRGEEDGTWLQSGKEIELEQGRYELNVHLCQEKEYDFTLSYYGEKDVGLERVKCMEEWGDACLCPGK